MKEKLIYKNMILHMKQKGITFKICKENAAQEMLRSRNYYFKVTAYRKCFQKIDGKYQNLDFAYLTDLAAIDARLRYYFLEMCLDVEHSLKTILNDLITQNPAEDGYSIVDEFKNYNPGAYKSTFGYLKSNKYLSDFYSKHYSHPSVWCFLEIMTFSTLCSFIEFYSEKYHTKKLRDAGELLKFAKNLRNASAHNNTLLVNLFSDVEKIKKPSNRVTNIVINAGLNREDIRDIKINDFVCLVYLHKKYTSVDTHRYAKQHGQEITNRMLRHSEYYKNNELLTHSFEIFCNVIAL